MSEPNLYDYSDEDLHRSENGKQPVLLITAEQLATRMNLSKRTIYRLIAAGKMIQPLRLGGIVRWRAAEIEEWIAAGCPSCRDWQTMLAREG